MRIYEIVCYAKRFQCYDMRFNAMVHVEKDILYLTVLSVPNMVVYNICGNLSMVIHFLLSGKHWLIVTVDLNNAAPIQRHRVSIVSILCL